MCELLPKYPDFCAVVIGPIDDQAFAAALKGKIEAAGLRERVRILGELAIEDVPVWYRRILIYAFTSRVEGFGLTLLEAMASGNALVAARAGAADKVVADGESGVLVPPGDAGALVRALEPLMHDPRRAAEMGARARAHAVEKFSADAEAKRIAEFYREVREGAAS
jgi:mannosyltransferase